jgi:hypothetical protein
MASRTVHYALRSSPAVKSSDLVLAMHGHLRVVTRGNDRPKKGHAFQLPR